MTNRFIIGSSGNSGATIETDESGTLLSAKRNGGSKDSVLVTHNHDLSTSTEGSDEGAHVHGVTIALSGTLSMTGSTSPSTGTHSHSGSTENANAPHAHPATLGPVGDHTHEYTFISDAQGTAEFGETEKDGTKKTRNTEGGGGHGHPFSVLAANAPHSHPFSITDQGGHDHPVSVSGADHGHPGSSVTGTGTHTHAVSTEGESRINKNLPPYYALFYIMRVV